MNKSKIIGFRPTIQQDFELDNIAKDLKVKKSDILRALVQRFIDEYYEEGK